MALRFDDYRLDEERFELSGPDGPIAVEPLVFDLLLCFAQRPGEVLSRDALMTHVWDGRIVSEATIASCVNAARRAIGDDGQAQRFIKTVRGRGFQFVASVRGDAPAPTPKRTGERMPGLAVAAFRSLGDDADLRAVGDGLASSLATVLTRVPLLRVFTGVSPSARYRLEGDLRTDGSGVRADVRLVDARDDGVIWAQSFDRPLGADVSAALLRDVLPRLEPQLTRAILRDAEAEGGGAQSRLLRAVGLLSVKGWSTASFEEASQLLREAVAEAPDLPLAHAYLAVVVAIGRRVGLISDDGAVPPEVEAESEAERALDLERMDSNVMGLAACALSDIGQTTRARPLLKRAIELNPNNAQAWTALGSALLTDGEIEPAVEHLRRGLEISPMDPRRSIWGTVLALALIKAGDLDAALSAAEAAAEADDRLYPPQLAVAACHALKGNASGHASAMAEARRIKPDLSETEVASLIGRRLTALIL